ncbi:hypothetical protein B0H19DRAFT_1381045, partial [Mycena capillaripes]
MPPSLMRPPSAPGQIPTSLRATTCPSTRSMPPAPTRARTASSHERFPPPSLPQTLVSPPSFHPVPAYPPTLRSASLPVCFIPIRRFASQSRLPPLTYHISLCTMRSLTRPPTRSLPIHTRYTIRPSFFLSVPALYRLVCSARYN